jgi:uncharacterized protein (TIGR00730 family)
LILGRFSHLYTMNRVAVFCASSTGHNPVYARAANDGGRWLAAHGYGVVYGGSHLGLMGSVANGALEAGGTVIGVLPRFMEQRELAHPALTELIWVESMQERKLTMHHLSDGVLVLPGGFGTLDELFEMLTWRQLGLHHKPTGLWNINGYYNPLHDMVQHMASEGLLKPQHAAGMLMHTDLATLIDQMERYTAHGDVETMLPHQA